jgi:hypothetical protein
MLLMQVCRAVAAKAAKQSNPAKICLIESSRVATEMVHLHNTQGAGNDTRKSIDTPVGNGGTVPGYKFPHRQLDFAR